jgi:phosphate:Na+ symporter
MKDSIFLGLNIIGGLGLFLYGLKVLSHSIQSASSEKLRKFFDIINKNKLLGISLGALVTMILQSSSATTVILVGFANAGVIGLSQAISIIFGANIGTTITAQIIAFKASNIALPLIGIGASFMFFSKNKNWKSFGEIILALGVLFLGLKHLSSFLKPLKDVPAFSNFLVQFGATPLLGIVAGMLVTVAVQSSSATTAMIITLASLGLIDFKSAFCLELGSNIGTTITAQIAAIGTNKIARRTAWAHTLFNVIGSGYMLILLYVPYKGQPIFLQFINSMTPGDVFLGENLARHCANAHTLFNLVNAFVLFPFISYISRVTEMIVPGKIKQIPSFKYLDVRMAQTPSVALSQTVKEVFHMTEVTKMMCTYTHQVTIRDKQQAKQDIEGIEDALNRFQEKIIPFLINLNHKIMHSEDINVSSSIIHIINRLERVGDFNVAILNDYNTLKERKKTLSPDSITILTSLSKNIQSMFQEIISCSQNIDKDPRIKLKQLWSLNQEININLQRSHSQKMQNKHISSEGGIIFIEMVGYFEQITDHLYKLGDPIIDIRRYAKR